MDQNNQPTNQPGEPQNPAPVPPAGEPKKSILKIVLIVIGILLAPLVLLFLLTALSAVQNR
mgnify:CR=1 FL=1